MNGTADLGKLYTIEVTIICPVHFFSWYTSNLILQLDSKMVWADSSTTDHITCTIFGWNIVTRFLNLLRSYISRKNSCSILMHWYKALRIFLLSYTVPCFLKRFTFILICIFCYPKLFLSHPRIPLCFQ
jgi:hypothetical protein